MCKISVSTHNNSDNKNYQLGKLNVLSCDEKLHFLPSNKVKLNYLLNYIIYNYSISVVSSLINNYDDNSGENSRN